MPEQLLIVDDEDSVRQTLVDWLQGIAGVKVRAAADAGAALRLAQEEPVDLAILDWNLGAGQNGLQLLEDLRVFCPNVVAILITGYAQQATPLHALRLGVRDFFDKSQEFTRANLQAATSRQLEELRPRKHERAVSEQLARFREAVEKSLAALRTAGHSPNATELGATIRRVLKLATETTSAQGAVLVWHNFTATSAATQRFGTHAEFQSASTSVIQRTLAGQAIGPHSHATIVGIGNTARQWSLDLAAEEVGFAQALLLPLRLAPNVVAVIELLHREAEGFTAEHLAWLDRLAPVATDLLRRAGMHQELHELLVSALESAVNTGDATRELDAFAVQTLRSGVFTALPAAEAVALAEQVQKLRQRFGPDVVPFVLRQLKEIEQLLARQHGLEATP